MIFFSKRGGGQGRSSNSEACVSILGLFLAIGLLGGLASLIYGLVKASSSAVLGGAVVLGVSVFFSVVLALVFIFCLKNNNVDSNANERRSHTNQRQHKQNRHQQQNRQIKHVQTVPHEVVVISGMNRSNQQQQSNVYDKQMRSLSDYNDGLSNSTNNAYGKQIPQPPNTSSMNYLHQSNGSMNHQVAIHSNIQQNSYNRH